MTFFTVISLMGPGRTALAIFSKESDAERYASNYKYLHTIEQWTVKGNYTYPAPVYAAHPYDEIHDSDKFIGLFASYELARAQEGPGRERIEVRELIPDK